MGAAGGEATRTVLPPNSTLSRQRPLPLTWPRCPRPQRSSGPGRPLSPGSSGRGQPGGDFGDRAAQEASQGGRFRLEAAAAAQARAPAAMQDGNFLLSALQPEAGVCSLALPSDLQLDRRGAEGPEAERLRAARVQEQVRARLLQLGQQPRHNGTAEREGVAGAAGGRRGRAGWAGARAGAGGRGGVGPQAVLCLAPGSAP